MESVPVSFGGLGGGIFDGLHRRRRTLFISPSAARLEVGEGCRYRSSVLRARLCVIFVRAVDGRALKEVGSLLLFIGFVVVAGVHLLLGSRNRPCLQYDTHYRTT